VAVNSFRKSGLLLVGALALVAVIAALIFVAVTGDNWTAPEAVKQMRNPVAANAAALAAARTIYVDKCANCHGVTGDGHGEQAKLHATKPPDFRNAAAMRQLTDGELFWKISAGRRPMPRFKNRLTEEERWELVNYIRAFSELNPAGMPMEGSSAPR
jgi:mono/diheme cytochrome c family protein